MAHTYKKNGAKNFKKASLAAYMDKDTVEVNGKKFSIATIEEYLAIRELQKLENRAHIREITGL